MEYGVIDPQQVECAGWELQVYWNQTYMTRANRTATTYWSKWSYQDCTVVKFSKTASCVIQQVKGIIMAESLKEIDDRKSSDRHFYATVNNT